MALLKWDSLQKFVQEINDIYFVVISQDLLNKYEYSIFSYREYEYSLFSY